jgi:hypothetical protein
MEVFGEELQEAVAILRISPGAGTGYPRPTLPGVRRVYLRRLSSHLYYTFDDAEVIVRAFWHAKRKQSPILAPR